MTHSHGNSKECWMKYDIFIGSLITYEISAPALKFLPPYKTIDDIVESAIALVKLSLRCFRIVFERGLRGFVRPAPFGGEIGIISTSIGVYC